MRPMRRVEPARRNATAQDAKPVRHVSVQPIVVPQPRRRGTQSSGTISSRTIVSRFRMIGPPSASPLRSIIRLSSANDPAVPSRPDRAGVQRLRSASPDWLRDTPSPGGCAPHPRILPHFIAPMYSKLIVTGLITVTALTCRGASGIEKTGVPAGDVSLELLVADVIRNNPEARFYSAEISAAKGELRTAGARPNPEVSAQLGLKSAQR